MTEEQAIEQMLEAKPLIGFSFYTAAQVDTLAATAQSIRDCLDGAMQGEAIDGGEFNRAYGLFWMWVLGAYEVTRTMCQARACFRRPVADSICNLKRRLAALRIPFAKQEYAGAKKPIAGEASVYGVSMELKDLSFEVRGTKYTVRAMLDDFQATLAAIKRDDVLHHHGRSYSRPSN